MRFVDMTRCDQRMVKGEKGGAGGDEEKKTIPSLVRY